MKKENLWAVGASVVSLVIYALTLSPGMHVGDSPEFITNAFTLGINHTTGYPLYTLFGRFSITLMPFHSAAIALNLMSAAMTAAGMYFLCKLMMHLGIEGVVAVSSTLAVAVSTTLWSRATIAEVYSFNVFAICLLFYLLFRWKMDSWKYDRFVLALAFLSGLLLTNHSTTVLIIPCIVGILLTSAECRRLGPLTAMIALFALGASVYLYLPIRSAGDPPIDWLNPETPKNLLDYFFPFKGRKVFGLPFTSLWDRLVWVLRQLLSVEYWYFAPVAVLGIASLKGRNPLGLFLSVILALNVSYCVLRRQPLEGDLDAALLPSNLTIGLLMGFGVQYLVQQGNRIPRIMRGILIALIPFVIGMQNVQTNNRSSNNLGELLAEDLLSDVEPNAVLFVEGDEQTFIPWYVKFVTRERSDLTIINRSMLNTDWHSDAVAKELGMSFKEMRTPAHKARLILHNIFESRPVYFSNEISDAFTFPEYGFRPQGLMVRVIRRDTVDSCTTPRFQAAKIRPYGLDARSKFVLRHYGKTLLVNAGRLINVRRFSEALCLLEGFSGLKGTMLKLTEEHTHADLLKAETLIGLNRWDEAERVLEALLKEEPGLLDASEMLKQVQKGPLLP